MLADNGIESPIFAIAEKRIKGGLLEKEEEKEGSKKKSAEKESNRKKGQG